MLCYLKQSELLQRDVIEAYSVDVHQTAPSDLGLHYLPSPVRMKALDYYRKILGESILERILTFSNQNLDFEDMGMTALIWVCNVCSALSVRKLKIIVESW